MQVHILSRGMTYTGLLLLNYVPLKVVDSILVMLSKLWYGDLTKYGIRRPEEGPFTVKVKYGKYPVIDVGTHQKIKSGHIQVNLPNIIHFSNPILFRHILLVSCLEGKIMVNQYLHPLGSYLLCIFWRSVDEMNEYLLLKIVLIKFLAL